MSQAVVIPMAVSPMYPKTSVALLCFLTFSCSAKLRFLSWSDTAPFANWIHTESSTKIFWYSIFRNFGLGIAMNLDSLGVLL